jgi:tripartite-type tricarboxylate transporter receptor subunit TctC
LLLSSTGPIAVYPAMAHVRFDTAKDLAPIAMVTTTASIMVVPPSLGVKTVAQFIALAKSKPGQLNYGTSGVGSASHLAMETFNRAAGINVVHIPYQGAAPAVVDLVGGNVQVMIIGSSNVLQLVKSGRLVALGVSSLERSALTPDLPAISETLPGYETSNWSGILAPARTPPAIIARINAAVNDILRQPETRIELSKEGFDVDPPNTPEHFESYLKSELVRWAKVVKDANIKA